MSQDGIFMSKSGSSLDIQIQDEELLEYLQTHHEDDATKILLKLADVGGKVVGEIVIPDTALEENTQL